MEKDWIGLEMTFNNLSLKQNFIFEENFSEFITQNKLCSYAILALYLLWIQQNYLSEGLESCDAAEGWYLVGGDFPGATSDRVGWLSFLDVTLGHVHSPYKALPAIQI